VTGAEPEPGRPANPNASMAGYREEAVVFAKRGRGRPGRRHRAGHQTPAKRVSARGHQSPPL